MNNFFIAGAKFLSGSVLEYANLPTPSALYESQFWLVNQGSGVRFPPIVGPYKYPVGVYALNEANTEWIIVPVKVEISEDTTTFLNIVDWAAFIAWIKDMKGGDRIIYNRIVYENQTGLFTSTSPNLDSTNWKYANLHAQTLQFDTNLPVPSHSPGRMYFDFATGSHVLDSGYSDVRVNVGREMHIEVYNNTASIILNGTPVSVTGVITDGVSEVILTSSSSVLSILAFAGVATMNIPIGEKGLVTNFGLINDVNTGSLALGFIYIGTNGDFTQVRPRYPEQRLVAGGVIKTGVTDGILSIAPTSVPRRSASKSYSFSSQGILAGLYYKAGFYDWATTSVTLNQGSLTQTHGTVGRAYAAHASIVPIGPGIVDTGQVGLRVAGIQDSELGIQIAAQTGIVTEDITTLTLDEMSETSEKFSGQIVYELYVVSGSPVNYSLTFNYGYSKYEDISNQDFTVEAVECVWQGNALDSGFDIALKHHKKEGWTYAATGFLPGNGDIVRKSVDQVLAGNVANNEDGAWKRVDINEFIGGNTLSEGILFEITTGQNNTIQTMDLHIIGFSEEL